MSIFKSLLHLFGGGSVLSEADTVVSTVLGLIHDAESKFPSGAEKLEHVRAGLQSAWSKFDQLAVTFEHAWPVLSALVTTIVGFYNASGAFGHKAK